MKIATWNVNSVRARIERLESWLVASEPDVLLLQETKVADAGFPAARLANLGYESAHYGHGQWNGVAILSRVGLRDVERGLSDGEARMISATCGPLRCTSCYVPNGRALDDPHYEAKLRWLEELRVRRLAHDVAVPEVIGGDFNVTPSDLDCYDPAVFVGATHVSAPERGAIRALEATGLTDAWRHLHPDAPGYSWWDYRAGAFHLDHGLRIDLLLVEDDLVPRLREVTVDRDARRGPRPSDHAPVWVDVELEG